MRDPLGRHDFLVKQTVSPGLVDAHGDALTPDVVDGEWWLSLRPREAMEVMGIDEISYRRIYNEVQDAVYTRDNRASQSGVRIPIILQRWRRSKRMVTIPGLRK